MQNMSHLEQHLTSLIQVLLWLLDPVMMYIKTNLVKHLVRYDVLNILSPSYAQFNLKSFSVGTEGYLARIYQETGECAFQKEYYHPATGSTVYSNSKRVDCFPNGIPLGSWIGMKVKVTTVPNSSDVSLEMYLDENDNGNWVLKHSYVDSQGSWPCSSSKTVPSECSQNNGDTVLRPGNVSFLRSDGKDETTEVHWRDASMLNALVSCCLY